MLTLSKTFQTATSQQGTDANGLAIYDPAGTPILFTDRLETQMVVPASGRFVWHTNPSTRPDVLRGLPGREPTGPTSPPQSFQHDPNAPFMPAAGAPVPGSYEERDFTIPSTDDNGRLDLHLEWPSGETELGPDDLDLRLYRRNELGTYEQIASSTNAGGAGGPHRRRSTAGRLPVPSRELVRDQRGGQELDRDPLVRASNRARAGDARSVEPGLRGAEGQDGHRGGDGRYAERP